MWAAFPICARALREIDHGIVTVDGQGRSGRGHAGGGVDMVMSMERGRATHDCDYGDSQDAARNSG